MISLPCGLDRLQKQARFVHLHSKALTNKLFKRAGKQVLGTRESLADAGLDLTWVILSHSYSTTELVNVWLVVCSFLTCSGRYGSGSSLGISLSNCVLKWRYCY